MSDNKSLADKTFDMFYPTPESEPIPQRDNENYKLNIVNEYNPAPDDYHTWIRDTDDIKLASDVFGTGFDGGTPDFDDNMAKKALDSGRITIYSSYPIEKGVFVTPSKMEAQSYAGNNNIYSKDISVDDVAWIDSIQGIYTDNVASSYINTDTTGKTPEQTRIINEYVKAVDNDLVRDISKLRQGEIPEISVTDMPLRAASTISNYLGFDVSDYEVVLQRNTLVNDIDAHHGIKGKRDNSMSNDNDIARMSYILNNYDDVYPTGKTGRYSGSQEQKSDLLLFTKRIDGTYYVVEVVPNTFAKKAYIISSYITKEGVTSYGITGRLTKENNPLPDVQASGSTSNNVGGLISDNTIPQSQNTVNDSYTQLAQIYDEYLEANDYAYEAAMSSTLADNSVYGIMPNNQAEAFLVTHIQQLFEDDEPKPLSQWKQQREDATRTWELDERDRIRNTGIGSPDIVREEIENYNNVRALLNLEPLGDEDALVSMK